MAEPGESRPANGTLRCGGILLAAGASIRMGQPKQLIPIAGQPLVVRAVEAMLATPLWPIVVVVGAHAEKIRPLLARYPVLTIENPAWSEGMASSLRTGIATVQQFSRGVDAALIALCDQPAFSAHAVEMLLDAARRSQADVVASHYNNRLGSPVIFRRNRFGALIALTGDEGGRALLNDAAHPAVAVDLPELGLDLDRPEDLAAWEQRTAR